MWRMFNLRLRPVRYTTSDSNVCAKLAKKHANLCTWGSLSRLRSSWVTNLATSKQSTYTYVPKKGHISRARTDYKYLKSFTWMRRDWEKNMKCMCLSKYSDVCWKKLSVIRKLPKFCKESAHFFQKSTYAKSLFSGSWSIWLFIWWFRSLFVRS